LRLMNIMIIIIINKEISGVYVLIAEWSVRLETLCFVVYVTSCMFCTVAAWGCPGKLCKL
jgi:hypothetical protein